MSTKSRLSWGTGIIITTAIFMMISVGTTIFFMNQDVDLVADNYYERELKYQKHIGKLQETNDLHADVDIQFSDKSIILEFPKQHLGSKISGEIVLYRPSSAGKDRKLAIALNSGGTQQVQTDQMTRGLWTVKISWQSGSNRFYSEKNIMVY